jgi:hypothetical protein
MRTPDEIAAELADTIRQVYARPTMYARVADIERSLWDFHWVWAIVHENETRLHELHITTLTKHKAPSGLFSRYMEDNPDASDDDALAFTLAEWRNISTTIGVPLDL